MTENEMKLLIYETFRDINCQSRPLQNRRKKLEFSKCILIFASIVCAGAWFAAAMSWFIWREFPAELVQHTGWFFGAIAAYMGKSGYENREKIRAKKEGCGK